MIVCVCVCECLLQSPDLPIIMYLPTLTSFASPLSPPPINAKIYKLTIIVSVCVKFSYPWQIGPAPIAYLWP
jgi:hypothetical protein